MTTTDDILADTRIEGLDISEALGRLNNSSKVYMRIIHSFAQNMPKLLDDLLEVTEESLPNYAIRVHGIKGSCYGIGAVACGDAAFALEKASKAGDWITVARENDAFVASVKKLIEELVALEERVENGQAPVCAAAFGAPDAAKLAALLEATKNYSVETMFNIIEELEAQTYTSGGEIVPWLREQFDSFAYDNIIERLSAL